MSKIKWVPAKRYEGKYEVSSSGEVRTTGRDICDEAGNVVKRIPPKVLTIRKNEKNPDPYVLMHDGERYNCEILQNLVNENFSS